MKKTLALMLAVIMLVSAAPVSYADEPLATREYAVVSFLRAASVQLTSNTEKLRSFSDFGEISGYASEYMDCAVEKEYILGSGGELNPGDGITRAEALVLLYRVVKDKLYPDIRENKFTDVPEWAREAVIALYSNYVVSGYDETTLGAEDLITVEQVKTLANRVKGYYPPRAQDDFYAYVNNAWISSNEVNYATPEVSSFSEAYQEVYDRVFGILRDIVINYDKYEEGTPQRKISDFIYMFQDSGLRNEMGIGPVVPLINELERVKNISELQRFMEKLSSEYGLYSLFAFAAGADVTNSGIYALNLYSADLILNDRQYYESGENEYCLKEYIKTLLEASGEPGTESRRLADGVYDMLNGLSAVLLPVQDASNPGVIGNKFTREELAEFFDNFDANAYIDAIGYEDADYIYIYNTELAKAADGYFTGENLKILKCYVKLCMLNDLAEYMTYEIYSAKERLNNAVGLSYSYSDIYDLAVNSAYYIFSEELGKIYVEEYYSENAKRDIIGIIDEIRECYKKRLAGLDWMSDETKAAAAEKLDNLTVFAGYPDSWQDSDINSMPSYKENDILSVFLGYLSRAAKEDIKTVGAPVEEPVFPSEVYMVNAAYMISENSIVIPAGILIPPFYDENASREKNLAGIGTVIAHELTHAFDKTGALYDSSGQYGEWWTEEEREAFASKTEALAEQFGGYEVYPGIFIDGEMTLSENIADLGAMSCIIGIAEAEQLDLAEIFRSNAELWRQNIVEEYGVMSVETDVHSPSKYRVNGILRNMDEFYEVFDVREGDNMYLAPDKRITIW